MVLSILDRLRTALADRYLVEREIGSGGMATVYEARDMKHERRVALKVLRPDLAAAVGWERFLREIRIAAQLHHPHILQLYDSGEADGFLYFVMPYVEGESLRDRLEREGGLPVDKAVQYAREIADALDYAHRSGVVHRDIKPENVMLSNDHVLVSDFGIALAVTAAGDDKLTDSGLTIGTPHYMSTEQASGDAAIDGRSDIYSLGCVLYEMLAGTPPFSGRNAQAVMSRHMLDPVPSIRTVRETVPIAVEHAVIRAMAKVAADRHATAGDFAKALTESAADSPPRTLGTAGSRARWAVGLLTVIAVSVVATLGVRSWMGMPKATDTRVLVRPFSFSGPAEEQWLSQALAVTIGNELRSSGLSVLGRQTAALSVTSGMSFEEIGRALDVTYVLDGDVRMEMGADSQVTIQLLPELIRTSDGVSVWSDVFGGVMLEATRFPASVTSELVGALNIALTRPQRRRLAREPGSEQAAFYHMRGRSLWHERTPEDNQRAIDAFELALNVDPRYAPAYAGLADAYVIAATYGWADAAEAYRRAEEYARSALALEPSAEAYAALGALYDNFYFRTDSAIQLFNTAIDLDPSYGTAYSYLAIRLAQRGDTAGALGAIRRARELDPLSPIITAHYAGFHSMAGRVEDGIAAGQELLRQSPILHAHSYMALAYEAAGMVDSAVAVSERGTDRYGHPWLYAILVGLQARHGDAAVASQDLARLEALPDHPDMAYSIASANAALGRADSAFVWLDSAFTTYTPLLRWLKVEPNWQVLRDDPRYVAALARRGF